MAEILIVEDEVLIAEQLKKYILEAGHTCCGHATSFEEAVSILNNTNPQIVLLDIKLYGNQTGIDLAHHINSHYHIPFIFLTSLFEKTILEEVKGTHPAGYITKPFQAQTLITTIEICLFNHLQKLDEVPIEIKEGKKIHLFRNGDIILMETDHVYTRIYLSDRVVLIRKSLNEITLKLSGNNFLRVHRSFLVNIRHVVQIFSSYIIVHGKKIPIGKTFKEDVMKVIKQ
jgi:two-component system, LytTR family, response regulator LytT